MKILNHVFTIINDKCNSMSVNGNFSLGVHEISKEDYDTIKSSILNSMLVIHFLRINVFRLQLVINFRM